MSDTLETKIKITGVRARVGRNSGVRFLVFDDPSRRWVTPSFDRSQNVSAGWLLLDAEIYRVALGVYLTGKSADDRVVHAELALVPADPSATTIEVDDVLEIWLETPQPLP